MQCLANNCTRWWYCLPVTLEHLLNALMVLHAHSKIEIHLRLLYLGVKSWWSAKLIINNIFLHFSVRICKLLMCFCSHARMPQCECVHCECVCESFQCVCVHEFQCFNLLITCLLSVLAHISHLF